MSGDLGPRVAISASQKFVAQFPDVELSLVGNEAQLRSFLPKSKKLHERITLIHAADVVGMSDDPLLALRQKKDSSMWVALDILRNDGADACVSAGNTGALLAIAKFLIKTFPTIERPAICKSMPVVVGTTYLLDLGANINCPPEHLHQFALMGSVLARISSDEVPRVALLNIGTEHQKGTDVLKLAQSLLQHDERINYVGFVEANSIFTGTVDVIVCDGFHGNIALKASEGTARFISDKISKIVKQNFFNKMLSLLMLPLLKRVQRELDPSTYNGASFLGLQKTVIKSHGGADTKAFMHALIVAREQVIQQVPARIQYLLTHH
ncbi:MAG: phosphate acyltransferase [Cellvibrio sp.]|jgi:glycerol-3-phosphate acyltransferase PlsX|nr:phosphate acyltransferase [Cellvibrio sp.]